MINRPSFRRRIAFGAAVSAIALSGAAWAQDANVEPTAEDEGIVVNVPQEEEARQQRITVTGSLIRNSEFSSASPIQIIGAEVSALEGLVNSADILQGSSIAAGSTQLNNQFGGFVVDGGTGVQSVDLRGCGGTRSLILINGKRPGPSGTRGAVGTFDFNALPGSIVQSYEILKDSGSTTYGSDAVCGVVNVITRTSVDEPEINVQFTQPFEEGGESFNIDGAFGLDFDNGSISFAGEYVLQEDLSIGDRNYLNCEQDLVRDPQTGERLDRVNRSITFEGVGDNRHCSNTYFNTVIDNYSGRRYINAPGLPRLPSLPADRLIPTPDGLVLPTRSGTGLPGYRPRQNQGFGPGQFAFYEDVLEDPRVLSTDAINKNERASLYGVADFEFNALGGVSMLTEVLYTKRKTKNENWRQFFPLVGGNMSLEATTEFLRPFFGDVGFEDTNAREVAPFFQDFFAYAQDPGYANPLQSLVQPVTLLPSNTEVEVDYYYASTAFSGDFGGIGNSFVEKFAWSLGANYSYSSGDYTNDRIRGSATGDYDQFGLAGDYEVSRDAEGNVIVGSDGLATLEPVDGSGFAPTINYFTADFLAGNLSASDLASLTATETGNTVYEQYIVNGSVSGPIFELPAGAVQIGLGFEYRDFSIDDLPGTLTLGEIITVNDADTGQDFQGRVADVWGSSTSGNTKGSDNVAEIFGEIEIPILKGQPFAEELVVNLSGRAFDYELFGSDSVYKAGFNWQIVPSVRVRGTTGTSYRAPALFELFLANQTGFQGQTAIDPCINLAEQDNQNIVRNCLADGIPASYAGGSSSALIISGGGAGELEPETSDTSTFGVIFTPTFADISIALDYYEIEIENQIAQLGPGTIITGCYAADNFPSELCNRFDRASGTSPSNAFSITRVRDPFLNVNSQKFRGIDLEARYTRDFNFGTVLIDADASWSLERESQLFAPGTVTGFDEQDFNGTIGAPSVTANLLASLERADWTYTWSSDFVGRMSNARFADAPDGLGEAYFGRLVNVDYTTEAVTYHNASVRWRGDTWQFTAGVRNVFDEEPPQVSAEAAQVRGNTPLSATQYDLRGRRGFVQVSKTF